MTMLAARYHGEGIEIYRIKKDAVESVASGPTGEMKPIREWGNKVLILGKEVSFYTRKKYPALSNKDLGNAVRIDVGDVFPLKEPSYTFKVWERADTYLLVDVWAWPRSLESEAAKCFPYTHVIPEDMAFLSQRPELTLFQGQNGITHVVAHNSEGFVGAFSFANRTPGDQQLNLFLKNVSEIAQINVYDQKALDVAERLRARLGAAVRIVDNAEWPASIEGVRSIQLKGYGAGAGLHEDYLARLALPLRIGLYMTLGWALMLYVTDRNYTSALGEIESRIERLSKDTKAVATTVKRRDETDNAAKIAEKVRGSRTPLAAMEVMAKYLPEDAYATRMVVSETGIDLSFSAKEPLKVIKSLSEAEPIKTVKLQGSPSKNSVTGRYNFILHLEMK
jgi:hypothetical protein